MLVLAFLAVLGEAATDLLEPWPLKIVFDYVFGTKHMPAWMSGVIGGTFGLDKVSILHFAVLAVILIALAGALSSYAEKYLTTSVGQWVMHDLRTILYHHIQRLSLAYHDHRPTGDLISTVTADIDSIQTTNAEEFKSEILSQEELFLKLAGDLPKEMVFQRELLIARL